MESNNPPMTPSPASRLSEEAMDLVCAFVREFEEDEVMAKALCALSLTSRRWTSSAVRALFADPTRSLPNGNDKLPAWKLLNTIVRRPGLAQYIKALDRLASVLDGFKPVNELEEVQLATWTLDLVRRCDSISSISIIYERGIDWPTILRELPYLKSVAIQARAGVPLAGDAVLPLFNCLDLHWVHTLSLSDFIWSEEDMPDLTWTHAIEVERLELLDFLIWGRLQLPAFTGLKHLVLRPCETELTIRPFLRNLSLPSLISLRIEGHRPLWSRIETTALRRESTPTGSVSIDPSVLDSIARSYPQLVTLNLAGCYWTRLLSKRGAPGKATFSSSTPFPVSPPSFLST
ncbi:hypothetical protein JCM8547_004598 [Rhodosporidiobolus lusitaniae]